jgi:16S rRNA processing protein RimM
LAAVTSEGSTGSASGAPADPRALPAGRVGRAHGLDGSFYVTGAQLRLLSVGTEVTVGDITAPIVRLAGLEKHPIVRLDGIEDRTAAERLRGAALTVEQVQAPALQPGEWWAHELEGCAVGDGERALGTVTRLVELPSCEALQVRLPDGRELLVPMVADAIRAVDVASGRIDVNLDFLGEPWT